MQDCISSLGTTSDLSFLFENCSNRDYWAGGAQQIAVPGGSCCFSADSWPELSSIDNSEVQCANVWEGRGYDSFWKETFFQSPHAFFMAFFRSWTLWSLWVPFYSGCSVILWFSSILFYDFMFCDSILWFSSTPVCSVSLFSPTIAKGYSFSFFFSFSFSLIHLCKRNFYSIYLYCGSSWRPWQDARELVFCDTQAGRWQQSGVNHLCAQYFQLFFGPLEVPWVMNIMA